MRDGDTTTIERVEIRELKLDTPREHLDLDELVRAARPYATVFHAVCGA